MNLFQRISHFFSGAKDKKSVSDATAVDITLPSTGFGNYGTDGRFLEGATSGGGRRPSQYVENTTVRKLISPYDRDLAAAVSNRLYTNGGMIRGAIDDKGMHVCRDAFGPIFLGADREWGRQAIAWLTEWFKQCEDNAPDVSYQEGIYLESVAVDRDGDVGVVMIRKPDGYPLIRHIPGHQIKNRGMNWAGYNGQGVPITEGRYAGGTIYDGVVFNEFGKIIAYKILGLTPDRDTYVPAVSMKLVREPVWFDQVRGYPLFFHALNDIRDSKSAKDSELYALNQASSKSLVEWNETGMPPSPADPGSFSGEPVLKEDGVAAGVTHETLQNGQINYYKAGSGSKLEMMEHSRPAENWRAFFDRVNRESFAGQPWPYELVYELAKLNTNAIRLILDKAQVAKDDRYNLLSSTQIWKIQHAISAAIDMGILPHNEEWMRWGVRKPKDSTIDRGRDGQGIREDYKMGFINLGEVLAKTSGKTVEEHWYERFEELAIRNKIRQEVQTKHGVEFDNREVQMLSANDLSDEQMEPPEPDTPPKENEE